MSYERSDVDPLGGAVSVRAVRCVCVCAGGTGTVYGTPRVRCSSRVARTRSARAAARAAGSGRGAVRSCALSRDAGAAVAVADASGIASSNRNRVRRRPGPTPRRPGDRMRRHVRVYGTQDPLLLKTPRNPEPFSQTRTRNTQRGTDTPPERHRREGRAWSPGEHLSARGL